MRRYEKALKQRNAALLGREDEVGVWTMKLAEVAVDVWNARRKALEPLTEEIARVHHILSGGREEVKVILTCGPEGEEGQPEAFAQWLERKTREDRVRGFTSLGPHRDRLSLYLNGRRVEEHASQGQQRTFALSLKLALLSWADHHLGKAVAFLLDDPGSELDAKRLHLLGDFLGKRGAQVFISCVNPDDVPFSPSVDRRKFLVREGTVQSRS
jgi:DNA replication and repair protein RecF